MCCIGNAAITSYSRNPGPCLVSARADPLEVQSNGRMIRLKTGSILLTGMQGRHLAWSNDGVFDPGNGCILPARK
jgi:hypothetical protein